MALILPPNWCLFFFRDANSEFTAEKLSECLLSERLTVTNESETLTVKRTKDGPTMILSIVRGAEIETILRGLVGKRRKHRTLIAGCDTYVKITFEDLEEILDDLEILNKAQWAVQKATNGLGYNSWNQEFWGPGE